ncbi:3-hydroxyacyl-CoA dehydrogenase NAD-binding domain-containing protein [Hymenobacter sp. BT770]|uniref:3-hydroxyacyl-CoA dehydrogenase NAD-binding domain-containing protein n=1 Tax=Hymenobacter sp. BT770 TaxID=2886942 RepID=UPI001D100F5A|nr:3-hydroxyacyl-CoA dehydrogenase NAD-binding domain-containing protein [Hymenobacter sp. BT770]MCC3153791.1 3-hydroxybutyryl-CoA dehydrogenase [Hymenobacter sp. BT770]MDO3416925.1 3-hydroxyacyl-CoA dehydrogenase NAD-binding domain-containing protein [Hymenobacter sp. BT770]
MKDIQTLAVVGAGTMGLGIAQLGIQHGLPTVLFDLSPTALEKAQTAIAAGLGKLVEKNKLTAEDRNAALARLTVATDMGLAQADLVIEAVVERLDVKHQLFRELAVLNGPDTILASNTSSLPITQLAAPVPHPERVVGMHFFNPAPLMPLVEVISGVATAPAVADAVEALARRLGKTPVRAADAPGFIVNRVARHYYVESLKIVEENVASFQVVDELLEASGFKMGPFRLMDLIGVDTNFSVTSAMYASFYQDAKFRPSRIQQQKVDAGHHGRKTGRGFYDYH